MLLDVLDQRVGLDRLALGIAVGHRRLAGVLHDRLVLLGHAVPDIPVDQDLEDRRLLVPAGEVVVFHQLVKAEPRVDRRHRELGRVDRALLHRREDLAAGQQRRGHAHPLHDLAAEPEEPHLEPFEVLGAGDLLGEPAGGLRRDDGAGHDLHVVAGLVVHLLVEIHAVIVIEPRHVFARLGAEGHGGEEGCGRDLARPVAGGGVARVDLARRHRVEDLEGGDQRARLVDPHPQIAARHQVELLGHARDRRAEARELGRERDRRLEQQPVLGVGGRCGREPGGRGHAEKGCLDGGLGHVGGPPCRFRCALGAGSGLSPTVPARGIKATPATGQQTLPHGRPGMTPAWQT